MAKAYRHALSSAARFGGVAEDYLPIHHKMDDAKSAHAEVTHRVVFHSAYGIYLIEALFGPTLENADGKTICVRDVAEQHVLEDLGFIPPLSKWLEGLPVEPWMMGLRTRTVHIVD